MTQRIAQLLPVVLLVALTVPLSAQPGSNDELRAKAEQGDVQAQYNLGIMYETGRGGPQDDAEAVRWYRLAAEQGDAEAQHNLGVMYATGKGVLEDVVTAYAWANIAGANGWDSKKLTIQKSDFQHLHVLNPQTCPKHANRSVVQSEYDCCRYRPIWWTGVPKTAKNV